MYVQLLLDLLKNIHICNKLFFQLPQIFTTIKLLLFQKGKFFMLFSALSQLWCDLNNHAWGSVGGNWNSCFSKFKETKHKFSSIVDCSFLFQCLFSCGVRYFWITTLNRDWYQFECMHQWLQMKLTKQKKSLQIVIWIACFRASKKLTTRHPPLEPICSKLNKRFYKLNRKIIWWKSAEGQATLNIEDNNPDRCLIAGLNLDKCFVLCARLVSIVCMIQCSIYTSSGIWTDNNSRIVVQKWWEVFLLLLGFKTKILRQFTLVKNEKVYMFWYVQNRS